MDTPLPRLRAALPGSRHGAVLGLSVSQCTQPSTALPLLPSGHLGRAEEKRLPTLTLNSVIAGSPTNAAPSDELSPFWLYEQRSVRKRGIALEQPTDKQSLLVLHPEMLPSFSPIASSAGGQPNSTTRSGQKNGRLSHIRFRPVAARPTRSCAQRQQYSHEAAGKLCRVG